MESFLLATVSASDELPNGWRVVSLVCFVAAAVLCLFSSIVRLFFKNGRQIGLAGALGAVVLGLIPLLFSAYVYYIDYMPVAQDGTDASGPVWKALGVPALPVFIGGILFRTWKKHSST